MSSREEYLLEKLEKENFLNVNDLAEELNVSAATIRRDLSTLEKENKLQRVPGGAIKGATESVFSVDKDLGIFSKMENHKDEKIRIAMQACQEVKDGECIFIDGGTSSAYMFEALKDRPITIVTNNHLFITQVATPSVARIIMLGGLYMTNFGITYGSTAMKQIEDYSFDQCFITSVGANINQNKSYASEIETRNFKVLALEKSQRKHLLLDASKLNVKGFCSLYPLDRFDVVHCNRMDTDIDYPSNFKLID